MYSSFYLSPGHCHRILSALSVDHVSYPYVTDFYTVIEKAGLNPFDSIGIVGDDITFPNL